jgi:hypothetical protein
LNRRVADGAQCLEEFVAYDVAQDGPRLFGGSSLISATRWPIAPVREIAAISRYDNRS